MHLKIDAFVTRCQLGATAGKSKKYMQVAIELQLRAMQFSADDSFLPTAAHVVLMEEAPEQFDVEMRIRRLPGYTTEENEYLGYPIRKL